MKIRTCSICGKEFESHNGILVCSDACRIERKRLQDKEGNYRRYKKLTNVPKIKVCPVCGKEFESLGCRKYCGKCCYEIARKNKAKENFAIYYSDPEWKKKHQCNRAKRSD